MTGWWMTRTGREKLLILMAAVLLAFALWYQFLLQPGASARAEALSRYERAVQTLARLDRIHQLQADGAALRPAAVSGDIEAMRRLAVQRAGAAGLAIASSRTASPATFQAELEQADPSVIFAWLRQLETDAGLRVTASSMLASGDGRVTASLEFATGADR